MLDRTYRTFSCDPKFFYNIYVTISKSYGSRFFSRSLEWQVCYKTVYLLYFAYSQFFPGKAYEEYFTEFQTKPQHWSLMDFDLWASKGAHQAFYKFLNTVLKENTSTEDAIKHARRLLATKKVSVRFLSS